MELRIAIRVADERDHKHLSAVRAAQPERVATATAQPR